MARKLRLEFPGALYHVINRGNYRSWIFADDATKAAFERCLFEACARSAWRLHAFVIMSNHYHLALETPEGNLVAGMQWLQATFANRFNRLRDERGHLFQSRYKSLLVEEGDALGHLGHYLHLNPVRAGMVDLEWLRHYRFSSYWYLWHPARRPAFLEMRSVLEQAGRLIDAPTGWCAYARFLAWQAAEGPAGKNAAYVSMSRGWAIGTAGFKARLIQKHNPAPTVRAWETLGALEMRRLQWQTALALALQALGRTETDCLRDRKSADWKIAIAVHLKRTTQASNTWLNAQLRMGTPVAVSQYVSAFTRQGGPAAGPLARVTEKLKT